MMFTSAIVFVGITRNPSSLQYSLFSLAIKSIFSSNRTDRAEVRQVISCKEKSGYRITANLLIGITSGNKPVSTQALDKYTMNSYFFNHYTSGTADF